MENSDFIYQAKLFNRTLPEEKAEMDDLVTQKHIEIVDTIHLQLRELARINNPSKKMDEQAVTEFISSTVGPQHLYDYGVWAYYPWLKKIVHLLAEAEFIQVRTSRNKYKITPEEIAVLSTKKVGIIGLSVGQSIAMTMAMERICGELRLADFDEVELSNMNRIRCSVQDLGLNKTIIAARQIAEQDPYLRVRCFIKGVTADGIDDFLSGYGKLDLLVEESDGIDMKIISRIKAKEYGIPVIMDTNDKGMLDVERFDLEPERPIFHGRLTRIEGLSLHELADKLSNLSISEKVEYLVDIIGFENVSNAMKASLPEMNKTIVGWPQLASAVILGGAMVTDVGRRILLNKMSTSGRYFVDFDEIIRDFKA